MKSAYPCKLIGVGGKYSGETVALGQLNRLLFHQLNHDDVLGWAQKIGRCHHEAVHQVFGSLFKVFLSAGRREK